MKRIKNTMKMLLFCCVMVCVTGCDVRDFVTLSGEQMADKTIEVLEEKYQGQEFEITGSEGLYYIVEDQDGLSFEVEPLSAYYWKFWCTDNYIQQYYEENGVIEACEELFAEYGMEGEIEMGSPTYLHVGYIDDETNRERMAEGIYKLSELIKPPFEVAYFEKGTPQPGENYEGSDSVGVFSVICLEYDWLTPHVVSYATVNEDRLFMKDIFALSSQQDYLGVLERIVIEAEDSDLIAKALDEECFEKVIECRKNGKRPIKELGDDFGDYRKSTSAIYGWYHGEKVPRISYVEDLGLDEEGNRILMLTNTEWEKTAFHVGLNENADYEKVNYSYHLADKVENPSEREYYYTDDLSNLTADNITRLRIDSYAEEDGEDGYPEDVQIEIDFEKGTICSGTEEKFRDDDDSLPEVKTLTEEQCEELKDLIIEYAHTVQEKEEEYWPQTEEYPAMIILFEYNLWFGGKRYKQDGACCYPDGWSEFVAKLMAY